MDQSVFWPSAMDPAGVMPQWATVLRYSTLSDVQRLLQLLRTLVAYCFRSRALRRAVALVVLFSGTWLYYVISRKTKRHYLSQAAKLELKDMRILREGRQRALESASARSGGGVAMSRNLSQARTLGALDSGARKGPASQRTTKTGKHRLLCLDGGSTHARTHSRKKKHRERSRGGEGLKVGAHITGHPCRGRRTRGHHVCASAPAAAALPRAAGRCRPYCGHLDGRLCGSRLGDMHDTTGRWGDGAARGGGGGGGGGDGGGGGVGCVPLATLKNPDHPGDIVAQEALRVYQLAAPSIFSNSKVQHPTRATSPRAVSPQSAPTLPQAPPARRHPSAECCSGPTTPSWPSTGAMGGTH